MIVDCHCRIWESPAQLGPAASAWLERCGGQPNLSTDPAEYAATATDVGMTLLWGFRSKLLGAEIPNSFLADFAAQRPDQLKAVAAIDPTQDDYPERLENIAERKEFAGLTVSPAAQGFHPSNTCAEKVYAFCQDRKLPLFVDPCSDIAPMAVAEFARPYLFDEAMRNYPALTVVFGSMGWPFISETVALLAKQPRAYAEISGLIRHPWDLYQALVQAHQAGVSQKLLFGSGYPFTTAATAIERIYRLNETTSGTHLPAVPRETLRAIVERDALAELGIS
jgi:predicted TIM-barrel fold metal-dependent hydrolase